MLLRPSTPQDASSFGADKDRNPGNVASFLKCGGGAGTTSLAVQAACAIAAGSRGGPEAELCVMDFDIQFGAVGLHLDIEHPTALPDLIGAGGRLDGTMLRGMMARHRTGFDVLPGPATLQPYDLIEPTEIERILAVARAEYRGVLLDLPQAWTAWTRAALACSDRIALVLQFSVPSIRHAQRQLQTLNEEGLSEIPLMVVANRVASGLFASGDISRAEAEAALERRIDHIIPADAAAMAACVNTGLPLFEVKGGRKLARRMAEIVESILAPGHQKVS